jgi:glycine/D-amino acid oxidase-like deaminating enzyme/nitrite reductase/ring-hydroxylating ferredoxin subunit
MIHCATKARDITALAVRADRPVSGTILASVRTGTDVSFKRATLTQQARAMNIPGTLETPWHDQIAEPSFPRLTSTVQADVAIVGAGITGLTLAALLKRAGRRVAVVEAQRIGLGTTGGSTAHLTEHLDTSFGDLNETFGVEKMQRVTASVRQSIAQVQMLAAELQIDCGFKRVPGYLYTEKAGEVEDLRCEAEAARAAGVAVREVATIDLPFVVHGAIEFADQAQFDPYAYCIGLAKYVHGDGSYVFEQSRVAEMRDGQPCQVVLVDGAGEVIAPVAVMATHAVINDVLLFQPRIRAYRSYVFAFRSARANTLVNGLYWDMDDPYHYTRRASDCIIVGGEDHRTGQEDDTEAPFARLEQYIRARFSDAEFINHWSAQFYEPADGLPYIGKYPDRDNSYIATGYSGTGTTFGTLAAMIIADQIIQRPNAYAELYNAGRTSLFTGTVDLVRENANLAVNAVKGLFKNETDGRLEDVPHGDGRVLWLDGEQVAVYRDEQGSYTIHSAVCTHAGCTVSWNTAEQSWDCPCHGGRFACTGEVLEGPPVLALRRLHETKEQTL